MPNPRAGTFRPNLHQSEATMRWLFRRPRAGIWIFCDGGAGAIAVSERSPEKLSKSQEAGCAAAAFESTGQLVEWAWQPLPAMTNNEAEYAGLYLGIELAQRLPAAATLFLLDSAVVVGQMQGRLRVHSPALRHWHGRITAALRPLPKVEFHYIPREYNLLADALARQARVPWASIQAALHAAHPSGEKHAQS